MCEGRHALDLHGDGLYRELAAAVVEGAVRDGTLSLAGTADSEIREQAIKFVRSVVESSPPLGSDPSREGRLTRAAEQLHRAGDSDVALVLYATHVEHWVDHMLASALRRRGGSRSDRREVLKSSWAAKTTWIWRLLFETSMPDDVSSHVAAIIDQRDAFLHYSWPASDRGRLLPERVVLLCETAPELVERLDALEAELLLGGAHERLRQAIVDVPPPAPSPEH